MKKVIIGGAVILALLLLVLTFIIVSMRPAVRGIQSSSQTQAATTALSDSDIVKKVDALPDVRDFIKTTIASKGSPHIQLNKHVRIDTTNNQQYWLVRVYKDGTKIPMTFAWYRYYLQSGLVQKEG
jgi:hypothetical protein